MKWTNWWREWMTGNNQRRKEVLASSWRLWCRILRPLEITIVINIYRWVWTYPYNVHIISYIQVHIYVNYSHVILVQLYGGITWTCHYWERADLSCLLQAKKQRLWANGKALHGGAAVFSPSFGHCDSEGGPVSGPKPAARLRRDRSSAQCVGEQLDIKTYLARQIARETAIDEPTAIGSVHSHHWLWKFETSSQWKCSSTARYHDAVYDTCYFILLWKIPHKWPKKIGTMML